MKKKLIVMIILTLAVFVTGCSSKGKDTTSSPDTANSPSTANSPKKEITIGFIPTTLNSAFYQTMKKGFEMKAKELGVKLNIQAGAANISAEEQLQYVETMLASGVDAIAIVPSSDAGLLSAIKKAQAANIPLINLDVRFDPKLIENAGLKPIPYIGTDNETGGKLLGEFVKANFPKGTETVFIKGIAGNQTNNERLKGFNDAVGQGYLNVVAEQNADWDVNKGYVAMQNMLSTHPNIKLVFALCDAMGIGARRAIEEAHKSDQIKIIGYDGIQEAIDFVKQGKFMADGAQNPGAMGEIAVQDLVDWINGKIPKMDTDAGVQVVTPDKIDEYLKIVDKYK